MKRSLLPTLVGVQTVLVVAFGWTAAYLGRDEFRMVADSDEARVPDHAASTAVAEPGGLPAVRVSASAQRSVGIAVARPTVVDGSATGSRTDANADAAAGVRNGGPAGVSAPLVATVADLQPLLELRGRLRAAQAELVAAQAASRAAETERARMQVLYDDDRNVSRRALDEARATAAAAAARQQAASDGLASSAVVARTVWGADLAAAVLRPGDAGPLASLLSAKAVLLRVAFRSDDLTPAPARLLLQSGGEASAPTIARRLAAVPAEAASPGRQVLYMAPAGGLATGMRVTAQAMSGASTASPSTGTGTGTGTAGADVLVPAMAVVWHAGQPWVYVREDVAAASTASQDDDDDRDARSAPAPVARAAASSTRGTAAAPSGGVPAPVAASAPTGAPANPVSVFRRRAVPDARRVDARWLLPGFDPSAMVVVRGAQVLLSEELKSQIGDEND